MLSAAEKPRADPWRAVLARLHLADEDDRETADLAVAGRKTSCSRLRDSASSCLAPRLADSCLVSENGPVNRQVDILWAAVDIFLRYCRYGPVLNLSSHPDFTYAASVRLAPSLSTGSQTQPFFGSLLLCRSGFVCSKIITKMTFRN